LDLLADHARLTLLDQAAELIGTSLDLEATCAELAGFAVPRFAELASVEILPPEALSAGVTLGAGPLRTKRTALWGTAAKSARLREPAPAGSWIRHGNNCPAYQCLHSASAHLCEQSATSPPWTCEIGTATTPGTAVLTVPLHARGQLIGVMSLLRTPGSAPFEAEVEIIQAVVDRAARSIDNARRHALAQNLTIELQRALLADPGTAHANLQLASRYLPCGMSAMVGGDWFEAVRLSFGRTLLVIGDVMGHGVEAAVDMSSYRTHLRYIAATDLPPHRILRQLDHITSQSDTTRPATCLLALVDPARRRCTLASAGHLPPALLTPARPAQLLDVPTGPPLGTGLGDYYSAVHTMGPGQVLLMYTDGLVERRTEDIDTSLARLTRLDHQRTAAPLEDLLDHVLATVAPTTPDDDIAILAAHIQD
jgi:serine phosphatase RsbU (regulator of sigma subunit)